MIDTAEALRSLVDRAREVGFVALDTEFVWERTYYPQLGIIQLGFSKEDCYLVDAGALDLSPLGPVLADAGIVKILHDARQDLLLLRRATGAYARNVFDTQLAAGFVGLSATLSLGDLVQALFGVTLPKTATRTDWLRRPLSDDQVDYALDDVRYLPAARDLLLERARERNRAHWVAEELELYDDPVLYEEKDPWTQYERVNGTGRLDARQLAVLRELAAWREVEARRQDRPRNHVVPDAVLAQVARYTPRSPGAMRQVRGQFDRNRYEKRLIEAVEAGLARAPEERPRRPEQPVYDEVSNARTDFALAYVKGKGLAEGVDPQMVATRADVTALVYAGHGAAPADHDLLSGWRREFIGAELQQILAGRLAVRLDPETGLPRLVGYDG